MKNLTPKHPLLRDDRTTINFILKHHLLCDDFTTIRLHVSSLSTI